MSRRGLLAAAAGAAGLAVGAGGTELAGALTATGDGTGPHVPSPGEELMVEHGLLKRLLLGYRAMHDLLAAGHDLPSGVLSDSTQIVSDYVESFHEGLEEAYVFPRVRAHAPDLIRTLLVQHDRGRHLTADLQQAAGTSLRGDPRRRERLAGRLAAYVRMYEPHEAWEDTVVYPALQRLTPQRTLDELAQRFVELEQQHYGGDAVQSALQRVASIEQRPGIHDLAAFTPRDVR